MIKKVLFALTASCMFLSANAQLLTDKNGNPDKNIFNHLSIGLNVGTAGIGFEVGTVCTPYLGIRAGFEAMPNIHINLKDVADVNVTIPESYKSLPTTVQAQYPINTSMSFDGRATTNLMHGKLLFDFFPWKKKFMFHLTVGMYIGSNTIVDMKGFENVAEGTESNLEVADRYNADINDPNSQVYGRDPIEINFKNGTPLTYDGNSVPATIRVHTVKPYFGIGVGRTVPRKRVGVKGELGIMYWGTPKIYNGDNNITDAEEMHSVVKVTNKIPVYPVLKVTVFGRIF